jgi:hypothetical protein
LSEFAERNIWNLKGKKVIGIVYIDNKGNEWGGLHGKTIHHFFIDF